MKIATFGVFDLIHEGHVKFLEKCKGLSKDARLVVVLARDSNVLREKGRKPLIPEDQRRYIVESLKPVDEAILGNESSDKLKIVEEIKPDIIVLGYNQGLNEKNLEEELKKRGLKVRVVRLKKYGNISTSNIKKKMERLKILEF
ncbi:MAG: FAD synthase [Candidatus Aenigmarchaeota archaeon]|nr:FAD synthase [Candidatus Aenigmarchaeota archaeon]